MRLIILILLSAGIVACSSNGKHDDELTEKQYYDEAIAAIEDENFFLAIEKLQLLESRYPFGKYSEQSQLEMIYTQFQAQELEGAKAAAERFIRLHPEHPNVDYAYYMRGLSTYFLGLSLVERYLSDEQAQRDPVPARDAFGEFAELMRKFPNSPYVTDARQRMVYLRNKLAAYEVHVGQYYIKRHAYMAAVNRGRYVVENYQGTPAVADALAVMTEAYELLGMPDLAGKSLTVLKLNFPEHPQLQDGKFVHSGFDTKDHRSLLNVITLGLFG